MERYPERTKAPIRCVLDDNEFIYEIKLAIDELNKIADPHGEEMIERSDELGETITADFLGDNERYITGLAYKGDSFDIDDTPEQELVQLSDYYPGGIVFRQDPRNGRTTAMLQFQDRREPIRMVCDEPLYEAYYFPLDDVLVYGDEHDTRVGALRIMLDAIVRDANIMMTDYDQLAPHEKERRMLYLAGEANRAIKGVLTGKKAELISYDFYAVDMNKDGEEIIMRVEKSSDTSKHINIYPEGTVLGCDYIERVMSEGGNKIPDGHLREYEPCVVLADDEGIIRYFVPIGTFGDALYAEAY